MIEINLADTVLQNIWYVILTRYLDDASLYYISLAHKAIFRTSFATYNHDSRLMKTRFHGSAQPAFNVSKKGLS